MSDDFRQQVLELVLTKRQLVDRVAEIRGRYESWLKANPTAAKRLRDVEEQTSIRERELDKQRGRWMTAYGL